MCLPNFVEAIRFKWEDTLTIVKSVRLGNGVDNLVAGHSTAATPPPLPRHRYPSTPPCTSTHMPMMHTRQGTPAGRVPAPAGVEPLTGGLRLWPPGCLEGEL